MNPLSQYIYESLQLPFSLSDLQSFHYEVVEDIYEDEYEKMKALIGQSYGLPFFHAMVNLCYKHSPQELYKILSHLNLRSVKRVLGAGSSGIVIDFGKEVCKVLVNEYSKDDAKFFKACHENTYKTLPRVSCIKGPLVFMEKLKTGNLVDFRNKVQAIEKDAVSKWHSGGEPRGEVEEWIFTLLNELRSMDEAYGTPFTKNNKLIPGDFKAANLGERPNGEIVFFDI